MKFSIKDFFSKYDQIRRELWIWSHLRKKSLMKNFVFFCSAVSDSISDSNVVSILFMSVSSDTGVAQADIGLY